MSADATWFAIAASQLAVCDDTTRSPAACDGIVEPELALDAVEGVRRAFEDGDRVAARERRGDGLADEPRALAVVGADERHAHALVAQHVGIQAVVDVDDDDAGLDARGA